MSAQASLRTHGDCYAVDGLLDFAVNVRRGRPAGLTAALEAALADQRYPDQRQARRALARLHGVAEERVLLLNGACEGFWLLAHALRPPRATIFEPTFSEAALALAAVGAVVESIALLPPAFSLETDAVPAESRLVVVTNPNNPTGRLERAEALGRLARARRLLVVDESFMDFARDRETLVPRALPGVAVLRSCTKLLSLAGVRAGYLVAEPELVARLEGARQAWPVSSLACAALEYYATARAVVAARIEEARGDRADLEARLARVPRLQVYPSETNFVLVRTSRHDTAQRLRRAGIAVRPADGFRGLTGDHVRIAARSPDDTELLATRLREVLADG